MGEGGVRGGSVELRLPPPHPPPHYRALTPDSSPAQGGGGERGVRVSRNPSRLHWKKKLINMVNKYLFILISILFYFNQLRQSGSTFSYQSWKAWIRILKSVGGKTGSGSHASSIFSPLYAEKNSPSFVGEVWLLAACLCVHKHGRNCAYFTCIKRRDPVLQDIRADNFNADDNSSNSAPTISLLTTIRQIRRRQCWR